MRVTNEQVILAASEVADKEGMSRVSLRTVADRLGIRTPSLYNHITSLENLLRQVAYNGLEDMSIRIRLASDGIKGDEALKAIALCYFRYIVEHPGIYEVIQWAMWHTDDRTIELIETYKDLLRGVIAPSGVTGQDIEDVLALITGFLHGYASLELSKVLADRERAEKQLLSAMGILIAGIKDRYNKG